MTGSGCVECQDLTDHPRKQRRWTHCSRCHTTWTSRRAAHCTGCHRTFGGVSGFDRHQREADDGQHVVCVDPAGLGMQAKPINAAHTRWGMVWGRPAPEKARFGDPVTEDDQS